MRPKSRPPDPLAHVLEALAAAEDRRREASRIIAKLETRTRAAESLAADRRRRAGELIRRGAEAWSLVLTEASADAARAAALGRRQLGAARRALGDLAGAERHWRGEVFVAIQRFLREQRS